MENKKSKKILLSILLLGFILRLSFAYSQYSGDVKNHFVWANSFLDGSVGFYGRHFSGFNDPNYPPLAILLFSASQYLYKIILSLFSFLNSHISVFPSFLIPLFKSENMTYLFLKLPGIIADLGVGLVVYYLSSFQKNKWPLLITSIYIFNPATIYLSSVWGQTEPVVNFFLLASVYFALKEGGKKMSVASIIFFTLAVLTKQTALWFIPFYLILWVKELETKNLLKGLVTSVFIFFGSYAIFGLNPIRAFQNYISTLSGSSTVVSDAAWNLWYYIFGKGVEDSTQLWSFSARNEGIVSLVILMAILLLYNLRRYSKKKIMTSLFIWSLLVFFLQTRVHERHLAPALVFNLGIYNFFPYGAAVYCFLSVFHLYNLIYSLGLPFI